MKYYRTTVIIWFNPKREKFVTVYDVYSGFVGKNHRYYSNFSDKNFVRLLYLAVKNNAHVYTYNDKLSFSYVKEKLQNA